jgi:hypothetical protein
VTELEVGGAIEPTLAGQRSEIRKEFWLWKNSESASSHVLEIMLKAIQSAREGIALDLETSWSTDVERNPEQ